MFKKITNLLTKKLPNRFILDGLCILFGAVGYAAAVDLFLQPAKIAVGGVTGVATVVNMLTKLPIGVLIFIINVPLVIISWRILGFRFIIRALIGMTVMSVAIDVLPRIDLGAIDPLLYCFFGGALMGVSLGIMYSRGYSTGGSDYIIWLVRRKFPHISTGVIYLINDVIVVVAAAIVNKSAQGVLYSVLTIYISQKAIDLVMSRGESAEMVYIISEKYEEIAACIANSFERGVTILYGKGFYSGKEKNVIMCAMGITQFYPVLSKIKAIDKSAFVVNAKANRVIGEGFKPIENASED